MCNTLVGATVTPLISGLLVSIKGRSVADTNQGETKDFEKMERDYTSLIQNILRWNLLNEYEVCGARVKTEIGNFAEKAFAESLHFSPFELVAVDAIGLPEGVR